MLITVQLSSCQGEINFQAVKTKSAFKLSRPNQLSSCQDEINTEEEILYALKHVKNTSKKQATFARIYSIMKKTHKNLTENELENVIENIVDKIIIECHQRNKSYTVPDFTDETVLAEQTQGTDETLHRHPAKIMKILLKRRSFSMNVMNFMNVMNVMKLLTKI